MTTADTLHNTADSNRAATIRFATVSVLALAMLVPLALVEGVTDERQAFSDRTFADIAATWGDAQQINGPYLVIPELHRRQVSSETGELVWQEWRESHIVLPDALTIEAQIEHQYRHRAIYEVPVYLADMQIHGSFPELHSLLPARPGVKLLLNDAFLLVGVSQTEAIRWASSVDLGGSQAAFTSGNDQVWLSHSVKAPAMGLELTQPLRFSFSLQLKGTRCFGVFPLGSSNDIRMSSTWPHPSFSGRYLPEHYTITDAGFEASWQIHELARNLPAHWLLGDQQPELNTAPVRVSLFQPVTEYRTVDRAIKYGLLFISLTFLSFICFELTLAVRLHVVQYGVVGIGLVLFYLALLSLSEHIPFAAAYALATGLLTALISGYVQAITRRQALSAWAGGIVLTLYANLYVLLQLEAFALLVGTGLLFSGLIALMYATRRLQADVVSTSG